MIAALLLLLGILVSLALLAVEVLSAHPDPAAMIGAVVALVAFGTAAEVLGEL